MNSTIFAVWIFLATSILVGEAINQMKLEKKESKSICDIIGICQVQLYLHLSHEVFKSEFQSLLLKPNNV